MPELAAANLLCAPLVMVTWVVLGARQTLVFVGALLYLDLQI